MINFAEIGNAICIVDSGRMDAHGYLAYRYQIRDTHTETHIHIQAKTN